jgi:hypothetical protein
MANSPLDYILQGAKNILDKGKDAFADQNTLGIVKNTVLGLPKAALDVGKKLGSYAKEAVYPTYGYSQTDLNKAQPTALQKTLAVPKIAVEMGKGVADLASMIPSPILDKAVAVTKDTIPGKAINKAGDFLLNFAKPKNVQEARAQQVGNLIASIPNVAIGSVKDVSAVSKIIAGTKDARVIAKELKGLGFAEDVIKQTAPVFSNISDAGNVERAINKMNFSLNKAKNVSGVAEDAKSIVETGKPLEAPVLPKVNEWVRRSNLAPSDPNYLPLDLNKLSTAERAQRLGFTLNDIPVKKGDIIKTNLTPADYKVLETPTGGNIRVQRVGSKISINVGPNEIQTINGKDYLPEKTAQKVAQETSALQNNEGKNLLIRDASRKPVSVPGVNLAQATKLTPEEAEPLATKAANQYWQEKIAPVHDVGGPTVIGADDLKDHFGNDYNDNNHPVYSRAAFKLYERALKESHDPTVILTGGGPASGKTELVTKDLLNRGFKGIIYDSNMSNYDGVAKQIKMAREAGKKIEIYGVIPNIEKSRTFSIQREARIGRGISDATFARGHAGFPDVVMKLLDNGVVKPEDLYLLDTRNDAVFQDSFDKVINRKYISDPVATLSNLGYNEDKFKQLYAKSNFNSQTGERISGLSVREGLGDSPIQNRADQGNALGTGNGRLLEQKNGREKAVPKIEPVDRLIASGQIRVVRRNGNDVYQYKKGGEWMTARNEDTAVNRVEPKPKPEINLPASLEEKVINLEMKKEAARSTDFGGQLEIGYQNFAKMMKSPKMRSEAFRDAINAGDVETFRKIATEKLGISDREFSNLFADYFGNRTDDEVYDAFRTRLEKESPSSLYSKDTIKNLGIKSETDLLKLEEKAVNKEISQFKKTAQEAEKIKSQQLAEQSSSNQGSAFPDQPKQSIENPYIGSTGEVRSLEKAAQQSQQSAEQNSGVELPSLPKIIQQQTPVSKKVGIIDYIRTPENVLKKIGLEKEAKIIRDGYDAYVHELPKNIDKITEWSKRIAPERNRALFRYLDGQAVDLKPEELKVATEIQSWMKEWAGRLGLPADNRIAYYITHIFDDQLIQKEFDKDLAKIISEKVPGSVYDPFLLKRLGARGYIEDTWRALDAYAKRATRKVHMDPALEALEEASSGLEESQWNYLKNYADRINMRPTKIDNLIDNSIKQTKIGYRLGQRPVANISRVLRQTTFRGMLGLNISSALRNLSQGANTYAKLGEKYTAIGYTKLFTNGLDELKANGVLDENFVQDRGLSSTKKTVQKLDKGLFVFFDTAEKINRGAAYFGAKAKALAQGKTELEAIDYAKKIVRDTQFLYGSIDTPLAMSSDIMKVFLQFLTYPVKQTEFLLGMYKNKEYMGIARYVLGGLAFVYTVGQVLGMDPTEMIPWYNYVSGQSKFGVPPSLKFPYEAVRAAVPGSTNDYGQVRTVSARAKDVGNSLWGVIPAGGQIKKTYQGTKAVLEGGSYDKSGRLQFPQSKTSAGKLQSILFGKYAGQNAQDYFGGDTVAKKAQSKVRPIYDQVQKLKEAGKTDEAKSLVEKLSDAEYEVYKDIKAAEQTKKTTSEKSRLMPVYIEVQKLKSQGRTEEAQAKVNALTDEEYRVYKLIKDSNDKQNILQEVAN